MINTIKYNNTNYNIVGGIYGLQTAWDSSTGVATVTLINANGNRVKLKDMTQLESLRFYHIIPIYFRYGCDGWPTSGASGLALRIKLTALDSNNNDISYTFIPRFHGYSNNIYNIPSLQYLLLYDGNIIINYASPGTDTTHDITTNPTVTDLTVNNIYPPTLITTHKITDLTSDVGSLAAVTSSNLTVTCNLSSNYKINTSKVNYYPVSVCGWRSAGRYTHYDDLYLSSNTSANTCAVTVHIANHRRDTVNSSTTKPYFTIQVIWIRSMVDGMN